MDEKKNNASRNLVIKEGALYEPLTAPWIKIVGCIFQIRFNTFRVIREPTARLLDPLGRFETGTREVNAGDSKLRWTTGPFRETLYEAWPLKAVKNTEIDYMQLLLVFGNM
ncbi:hypothetical protein HanXRQr2_Chr07g0316211 [Helianthus annuus]|uniref:Uncharacterized protein n=1 Tax=Helianthus annuus TaxID=4232 RepID=A0A9K3INZ4_HELAN|nr:hypothetical protein HanXRQr2_Chr07g0316211 [Helianthus annuus]